METTQGGRDVMLDVRGEACPIPEMRAAKELQKMGYGRLVVLTDHEPAIDVTLPSLCKSLGLKYKVQRETDYVKFIIFKETPSVKIEETEGVSETESITIRATGILKEKLSDPTILMSFVPQVKAVDRIAPNNYVLHMKWFINWETPLVISSNILPRGEIVYYTAYQKLPMFRIRFGWRFVMNKRGEEINIDITEWYNGPFKATALKAIKKHLQKAKEVLPKILL